MARQTSISVYHEIEENGLLSERRRQVYQAIFHYGPMTAEETLDGMIGRGISISRNSHTRFTELRDCGVIKEIGVKKCSVTGYTAILWDVTDQLPKKVEKKQKTMTYRQLLKENSKLKKIVEQLECDLGQKTKRLQRAEAKKAVKAANQLSLF